jgi:signal transduction histidine kinase
VFYRRLNFHISFNLVFLLALAMLLIDFVVMGAAQRLLLRNKAAEGALLIAALEDRLDRLAAPLGEKEVEAIHRLLKTSGYACALIVGPERDTRYVAGGSGVPRASLAAAAQQALASNQPNKRLTGTTWGVFWRQKANLILSAPLHDRGRLIAGISIVCHLQPIYGQLRHAQQFVFVYILINLILLTLIGRYRFSRLTISPLKKLVETAEGCKEGGEALFLGGEKEGNEFHQLSNALNQMLHRISKDQEDLRRSVHSLEQANLDLKRAQDDIINAEKLASVGRLSAGIAHEIGNPLAIIIGYLDLLKRNDISAGERRDFISRTESEIHRINQIIRQLLDFSRPSNNAVGRISVHDVLSDIATIFTCQPLMKNMQLALALAAPQDRVAADAALLRQAFLNIVINAADAAGQAHRPGSLTIETRNPVDGAAHAGAASLEITFADNGMGIPEKKLKYIFEPFYTTKAPGKGTGLGLSVCYMIIEASGGRIKAHSQEGVGTRMVIELPLCAGGQISDA